MKVVDNKKLQIFDKLAASGADTEKKITALEASDMVRICLSQGMQIADMEQIIALQEAIKSRRQLAFFTGGIDETEEKKNDKETKSQAIHGIRVGSGTEEAGAGARAD